MFQISVKTDYGLLIMFELAKNKGEISPLSPLAKKLGVSSSYLSQIANSLQQAGLIKSQEGISGGYYLARRAKEISALEILEALSGKIQARCAHGKKEACPHTQNCALKSAWPLLLSDIKKGLAKRSLASLLNK